MATTLANNECYFCTEKFVSGHKCGGKGVFLLEMEDGVELDHGAEDLGISLQPIIGIDVSRSVSAIQRCWHSSTQVRRTPLSGSWSAHGSTPGLISEDGKWRSCQLLGGLLHDEAPPSPTIHSLFTVSHYHLRLRYRPGHQLAGRQLAADLESHPLGLCAPNYSGLDRRLYCLMERRGRGLDDMHHCFGFPRPTGHAPRGVRGHL